MEKIKKIELCVRIDPNPPSNAMKTVKVVKSLKGFSILPNYFENKMVELIDLVEGFQDNLVPHILDENKNIKYIASWRNEAITMVNDMVKKIVENMDIRLFKDCISRLVNYRIFFEHYEKEGT